MELTIYSDDSCDSAVMQHSAVYKESILDDNKVDDRMDCISDDNMDWLIDMVVAGEYYDLLFLQSLQHADNHSLTAFACILPDENS